MLVDSLTRRFAAPSPGGRGPSASGKCYPMILARIIGQVIATQKEPSHEGQKILLVQPLTINEEPFGDPFVALDAVDAGVGDRVLAVQEGFSAMTAVGHTEAPIDAAVIGVVDRVELA